MVLGISVDRTIAANSTGQPNILTAIVNSDFYALNQQIGDQLASHLPEKFGLDHFKNNFSQVGASQKYFNATSCSWHGQARATLVCNRTLAGRSKLAATENSTVP